MDTCLRSYLRRENTTPALTSKRLELTHPHSHLILVCFGCVIEVWQARPPTDKDEAAEGVKVRAAKSPPEHPQSQSAPPLVFDLGKPGTLSGAYSA